MREVKTVKHAKDGCAHVRVFTDGKLTRDYSIHRGAYAGTTDNNADKWYATWVEDGLRKGTSGQGYPTKAEAIEYTAEQEQRIGEWQDELGELEEYGPPD